MSSEFTGTSSNGIDNKLEIQEIRQELKELSSLLKDHKINATYNNNNQTENPRFKQNQTRFCKFCKRSGHTIAYCFKYKDFKNENHSPPQYRKKFTDNYRRNRSQSPGQNRQKPYKENRNQNFQESNNNYSNQNQSSRKYQNNYSTRSRHQSPHQQASLINLEFTIIRVGHKIDQIMIDTIAITKLTGPVVTKGKSIIIHTTIDHGRETKIVIAAIEPQTAQVNEINLGTEAVDKVPEYTVSWTQG